MGLSRPFSPEEDLRSREKANTLALSNLKCAGVASRVPVPIYVPPELAAGLQCIQIRPARPEGSSRISSKTKTPEATSTLGKVPRRGIRHSDSRVREGLSFHEYTESLRGAE